MSFSDADAIDFKFGYVFMKLLKKGITVLTWVCWSIISEIQILYGDTFFLQGKLSLPNERYQAEMSCENFLFCNSVLFNQVYFGYYVSIFIKCIHIILERQSTRCAVHDDCDSIPFDQPPWDQRDEREKREKIWTSWDDILFPLFSQFWIFTPKTHESNSTITYIYPLLLPITVDPKI